MYAMTTTGHREHTSGSKETKVIQMLYGFSTPIGAVIQDITTTIEEWSGLSYTDVQSIYTSTEESTLGSTTRPYLGNAVLTQNATPGAWCRVVSCWGTKVTTSFSRMGNTNLYQVTKTTVEYTVRGSGDATLTLE